MSLDAETYDLSCLTELACVLTVETHFLLSRIFGMSVEIFINFTMDPIRNYVGWASSRCAIRSADGAAKTVRLANQNIAQGGQLVFLSAADAQPASDLQVNVPAEGISEFYIAGSFDQNTGQGFPSIDDGDAAIEVFDTSNNNSIHTERLMVRVRKNANELTPDERDRFLTAIVTLNQNGNFVDFQNMHVNDTSMEVHGRSCFLPWHRFYLLDLERKLQRIDPSVSLPYWRFDQPSPNVFTSDFMGVPDATGLVQFSSTNPLVNWRLTVFGEGSGRIRRNPQFDTANDPANIENDEADTFALGTTGTGPDQRTNFENFERMEGDPHGTAHVSFQGQIAEIGRAPADPLFFMLHCNVDRLWAKWQWLRGLYDPNNVSAYYKQGSGPINSDTMRLGADRIGNYSRDTLWPWNGRQGDPRPRTAPGTYFPDSFIAAPDRYPDIQSAMDFQGQLDLSRNLGFAYDDVPYDHV